MGITAKSIEAGEANGVVFELFSGSWPRGLKMAPRWPYRVPRQGQDRAKMTPDRPKTSQDSPKTHQDKPKKVQDSPTTGVR